MPFDITTLGVILIDMFPSEIGKSFSQVSSFIPTPGGPANAAVASSKLGGKSAFIGKVGDDPFGHWLAETLSKENVNIKGLRYSGEVPTTVVFITQPHPNSYEFIFYRNPGADILLTADELDSKILGETKCFHFDSLSLQHKSYENATFEAIRISKKSNALISYDVNYRPTLWKNPAEARKKAFETFPFVDLVKINEKELEIVSGTNHLEEGAKKILEGGPEICVITLGEKGSYIQTAEFGEFIPVFKVNTVDSAGCGDAFVAGLLLKMVEGNNWRDNLSTAYLRNCMIYASAVGALTSLNRGVIPALPTKNQVEEIFNYKRIEIIMESKTDINKLKDLARQQRLKILDITLGPGGHVSSCFSAVEIFVALYFGGVVTYNPEDPYWEKRDRVILSKGHAAPGFYTVLAQAGFFPVSELSKFRMLNTGFHGHPVKGTVPGIEFTSGSLGQGLSFGLGMALAGKLSKLEYRVFVVMGDGECQEGQVWEAAMAAAHYKTDHLIAIIDHNKYQQTGPINREMSLTPLSDKWTSFGWSVIKADGHDLMDLIRAIEESKRTNGKPFVIIADTVKGKGVSFIEKDYSFHGKSLNAEQLIKAREEILCN